ncbi:post-GPI attachment to proteins factor 2-like [Condylostylus longicornis]|uniref:post-GPI attachment to proteins factor 2-like n=1 Tax=Condylostylus longicornis TaxID=2530218 RepID=UPI00244E24F4|nr:post-GPI attachment to proteins factor 2-like [Condylostylus longicornis]
MIPSYVNLDNKYVYKISIRKFAVSVACLPLFSFIFCVLWCLLFNFEESTSTHCHVANYLPSISAAIGSFQPQKFVWQTSICLHFLPRLLVARLYFQFYEETIRLNRRRIARVAVFLNVIENFALMGLTLWTSSMAEYEVHKFCFISFIITSDVYMILSYVVNKNFKKFSEINELDRISLKCKKYLMITNIISICIASLFFLRHNQYCRPMDYTLFAFFEYIVVLTNIGYHLTVYWDFHGRSIVFDWGKGFYTTHQ